MFGLESKSHDLLEFLGKEELVQRPFYKKAHYCLIISLSITLVKTSFIYLRCVRQ